MIPALLSFLGGVIGNVANSSATRRNNATNIQLARERNAMQQSESQLAYERSKPTTQVNNLMAAGMSKAGALSTLNGGGSYTPAPIQSAKTDAPQVDTQHLFDGLMTTWENNKSRKSAEDMQAKQIEHDRRTHARDLDHQKELKEMELENAKEIAKIQSDSSKYSADKNYQSSAERLAFDKEQFEYNKPKIIAEINQIKSNTKVLNKVAEGHNLDNIRKEFENKQLPEMAALATTEGWQRIQHVAQQMAHENADAMNKQERETLELEFYRATMDANINLANLQAELQSYLSSEELNLYDSPVGGFIGALAFCMDRLVPKFALFK